MCAPLRLPRPQTASPRAVPVEAVLSPSPVPPDPLPYSFAPWVTMKVFKDVFTGALPGLASASVVVGRLAWCFPGVGRVLRPLRAGRCRRWRVVVVLGTVGGSV